MTIALPALGLGLFSGTSHAASYTCVKNYYVDGAAGSDGNNGAAGSPWKTINHSAFGRSPGDCVNVRPGVYTEVVWAGGNNPPFPGTSTATGYFVLRSVTPGGAKILSPLKSGVQGVLNVGQSYMIVDGFEINGQVESGGAAQDCIGVGSSASGVLHHIKLLNNSVHDCGGSGISIVYGDLLQIDHNVVYNNATTSQYQKSGISIWEPTYYPSATNNDDQYLQYRIDVTNNWSYNNTETNAAAAVGQRTDGNGIIFDTFSAHTYTQPSHIAYNVVFGNGGKGIQLASSNDVVIDHNTAYGNNQDTGNPATWRAEINSAYSSNVTVANNLAYAVVTASDVRKYNSAYLSEPATNTGFSFTTNLSFNGTVGAKSLSPSMLAMSLPASNLLGVNPDLTSTAASSIDLVPTALSPVYYKDIGFE